MRFLLEFNTDMIPHLILSRDNKKLEAYVKQIAEKNSIPGYNIITVYPEKNELGIDQVRNLSHIISTQMPQKRIVAVFSFETASTIVQNSLLKTLEEKNKENLFILCARQANTILSTVRSRVRMINLDLKKEVIDEKIKANLQKIYTDPSNITLGSLLSSELLAVRTKEDAVFLVDHIILFFREMLKNNKDSFLAIGIIRKCFLVKDSILTYNSSPHLSVDNLLIFIHKTITMR